MYFRTLVGYEIDMDDATIMKDFQNPSAFEQQGSVTGDNVAHAVNTTDRVGSNLTGNKKRGIWEDFPIVS